MNRIVLDAAAFDFLDHTQGAKLRDLLRQALHRGGELWCSAITIAEVARSTARTRHIETSFARQHSGQQIRILNTDPTVAKLVGAILYSTGRGSDCIADAHVIAVCAPAEHAVVITSDPDDIAELSAALPGTRVVTRSPQDPA